MTCTHQPPTTMKGTPYVQLAQDDLEYFCKGPIQSFSAVPGCAQGDNVCSELLSVEATLRSGEKCYFVFKTLPKSLATREMTIRTGMFWNERIFYSDIIQEIKEALKRFEGIDAGRRWNDLFPNFISGFNDNQADFICLTDERYHGFRMSNKREGLTQDETSLAMKTIAQFHAYTYFFVSHKSQDIHDFWTTDIHYSRYNKKHWVAERQDDPKLKGFLSRHYRRSIDLLREKGQGQDIQHIVERLSRRDLVEDTQEIMARITYKTDVLPQYFPLVIHSDLWLNNMLFRYEDKKPVQAKLLDFQQVRKGNIYEDLTYFMYTSTTPAMRSQKGFLEDMLGVYVHEFEKVMKDVDCPMPPEFCKDKVVAEFKGNIESMFLFSSFFLPLQLGEEPEKEEVEVPEDEIEEEYEIKLIKKFAKSPLALQRFEEMAREVVELGVL